MKAFFKKFESPLLIESTKAENATFPYKTDLSEANLKTNRMGSTKWTYDKEWILPLNFIFFEDFFFNLRIFYKELI